jgi:acetyl esterase/lipase
MNKISLFFLFAAVTISSPHSLVAQLKNPEVSLGAVKEFTGSYSMGPSFVLTVTTDGRDLYIKFPINRPFTLDPLSTDTFAVLGMGVTIAFDRDGAGAIAALIMHDRRGVQRGAKLAPGEAPTVVPDLTPKSGPPPSKEPPPKGTYSYSKPEEPTIENLAYADKSPAQKLDLYLPAKLGGPAPVVIWMHGGGFFVGDKTSMPRRDFGPAPRQMGPDGPFQIQVPDVTALTAKGYAVVSLNYQLKARIGTKGDEAFTAAFTDAKYAVRFLRANAAKYNLDPTKFAVWGNSAGGYMAAILGVTGDQPTPFDDPKGEYAGVSSAVQAVVVWYGVVDDVRLPPEFRMIHYLPTAKIVPAFLIANGDADQNVPADNARQFHESLVKAGFTSTLTILSGARHEDPAFMSTQMTPTFEFLDKVFGR